MTTQPRATTVVIALMTTTASAFPTLAHGLATLDAFPIAGALQIAPDQPGVDFDALERARVVLVQAWRNDLTIADAKAALAAMAGDSAKARAPQAAAS